MRNESRQVPIHIHTTNPAVGDVGLRTNAGVLFMSRHYGTIIEPDDQEDFEPHERDDFAEMQQELADIADRERTELGAEKFYENLLWERP